MKPRFITFTGFDAATNLCRAAEIAMTYPVEYGFLFSPTRTEILYHKNTDNIKTLLEAKQQFKFKLAAHLCGGYARAVNEGEDILSLVPGLELFDRWQINSVHYNFANCAKWAVNGREIILQSRSDNFSALPFPNVYWLYDRSGGKGLTPDFWPYQRNHNFVGYAGGLKPSNVQEVVEKLHSRAYSYWLDMESGVRTEGLFDLEKVEEVCKRVYDVR